MSSFRIINNYLIKIPTPLAGLALAIASLGLCWDSAVDLNGSFQVSGALLSSLIMIPLFFKFLFNPSLLKQELAHPVVGGIIPTGAMAIMVIANAIAVFSFQIGQIVSWFAIIFHLVCFIAFIFYRSKNFTIKQVLPSWFIPPIGLVMAVVTHPGGLPHLISNLLLLLGFISYAVLLPAVLYSLIFSGELKAPLKPLIAILAAPASILLLAYLTASTTPSTIAVGALLTIAIMMTFYIYFALIGLLRLPFSPAYSSFTFPLVVSAIALIKTSHYILKQGVDNEWYMLITQLANIELIIASTMVCYVIFRFIKSFLFPPLNNLGNQKI